MNEFTEEHIEVKKLIEKNRERERERERERDERRRVRVLKGN